MDSAYPISAESDGTNSWVVMVSISFPVDSPRVKPWTKVARIHSDQVLRPDLAKYLGEAAAEFTKLPHCITLPQFTIWNVLSHRSTHCEAKFTSELGALFGAWLMDPVFSVRYSRRSFIGLWCTATHVHTLQLSTPQSYALAERYSFCIINDIILSV